MRYLTIFIAATMLMVFACQPDVPADNPRAVAAETGGFTPLGSEATGVDFVNHVEENFTNFFARFQYVYNGGGVAIGDVDGDGLSDLFFTANEGPNRLYRNLGDFTFEEVTEQAGLTEPDGWDNGTVMADINGDGHLDIYVCRGGSRDQSTSDRRRNLLYLNDGKGHFREVAREQGLADEGYSLHAVFFDMDNDNDLDAYVTNRPDTFFLSYQVVLAGKKSRDPVFSDQLYRNDGGRFTRVTETAGITGNFGYGLGVTTADVNNDGFEDILVSNDYLEGDYLYENQGDGTFVESIEHYTNHTSFYGMGIDATDLNNDGYEDLLQLDMSPEDYVRSKTTMASMNVELYREIMTNGFHDQYMHNSLQLNRGNGFFSEISQLAGVAKSDWSWAVLGADFDNDADKEIFITNGIRRDMTDKDGNRRFQEYMRSQERRQRSDEENAREVIGMFNSVPLANYLYDRTDELRYENRAAAWQLDEASFSNGAAYGDLDNDGDLDLVVNNLEAEAFLYRNDGATGEFLRVDLVGPSGNVHGLGAKVWLQQERGQQFQQVKTVRGYLSSVEPIVHFGLGTLGAISSLRIRWPDGKESIHEQPAPNQVLRVQYGEAIYPTEGGAMKVPPLLTEVSDDWFTEVPVYRDNDFDDYASQVLLPHGHSRSGPALAVGDVNGDGLQDFYFGGAKRATGRLFLQTEEGAFVGAEVPAFAAAASSEDAAAAFMDADGDGDLDLYVVSGGSEFPDKSPSFQDRLYTNDGRGGFAISDALPEIRSSGGCVVPYDMDGDGDLDLFVGGRVVPARYPAAPRSYLLENREGRFVDVTEAVAPELADLGMITSAVWSDLNDNGTPELVIVGEWLPITIFEREGDTYRNTTADYGLATTQGWWNRVITTDVDGDGDDDFVLGNLGLNYKFKASDDKPFYVIASDFDRNGSNDIFLAKKNDGGLVPIRGRECSSQQIPGIADKFPTYNDFAAAGLEDIIDLESSEAMRYEAREFASCWMENDGGSLTLHRLPVEAQFSVVTGIVADDVNGDGVTDLITAGNKFDVEIETTRADAGLGTLMLGGPQGYEVLSPASAGLALPENVKGLYPILLGQSGQRALLVAVNEGALRLMAY